MTMLRRLFLILTLAVTACGDEHTPPAGPTVLAAASTQEALAEISAAWAAQGRAMPLLSFAGSPTIARQAANGAPADIVLLADEKWMNRLEAENLLARSTRRALIGNRMVLVAPAAAISAPVSPNLDNFPALLGTGRLAMADPESVPAGRYGKAALESLGLWGALSNRIAPTENVRAALALVERGEAPFALVYATDLAASEKVSLAAAIPASAHPPIRYSAALMANSSHRDAPAFLTFLSSRQAQAIFTRHRFTVLDEQ